jgi:DNA-binding transcriptional LysR family regulator
MTVELRRFRYFVAVAEELHFRRAAERLHLAQPALSQQVRKLEIELGVDLFHRTRRGVALTTAGAVFLDEARRVLRQADEAARAAHDAQHSGAVGRLRLGLLADAVPTIVPRTIIRFSTRFPGVEVAPETVPARRAIEDVRAGRLDVAVIGLPAPVAGLQVTPLCEDGTVAAVAERHPLSGRDSIPLARLAEARLVVLPRATNPAFYDGVIAACRNAGLAPSLIETSEPQVEHALLTVAGGAGIAILPASAAERFSTPGVRFCALEPPAPATEIALVTRAEANDEAMIRAFLRFAREPERPSRPRSVPAALAA